MGKQLLKELKEKAGALTMEEDLELIDHLVHKIRTVHGETPPKRKWNEI